MDPKSTVTTGSSSTEGFSLFRSRTPDRPAGNRKDGWRVGGSMGAVVVDPVSLACRVLGFACLRSRALALPVWNRDEHVANFLACHLRMEWYNSARHLQTRPLHPQTHPVQLFDVLERICGTAPNRDLGLCDEARKCSVSLYSCLPSFRSSRIVER